MRSISASCANASCDRPRACRAVRRFRAKTSRSVMLKPCGLKRISPRSILDNRRGRSTVETGKNGEMSGWKGRPIDPTSAPRPMARRYSRYAQGDTSLFDHLAFLTIWHGMVKKGGVPGWLKRTALYCAFVAVSLCCL